MDISTGKQYFTLYKLQPDHSTENVTAVVHKACRGDERDTIQDILDKLDVETRTALMSTQISEWAETALHVAAHYSSEATVKYLIQCLPTLTLLHLLRVEDRIGRTPLHLSADNDVDDSVCLIFVDFLMAHYFIHKQDVKEILCSSASKYGSTFLHCAAEWRPVSVMAQLLVTIPSDILSELLRARDRWGRIPLHRAALNENGDDGSVMCLMLSTILRCVTPSPNGKRKLPTLPSDLETIPPVKRIPAVVEPSSTDHTLRRQHGPIPIPDDFKDLFVTIKRWVEEDCLMSSFLLVPDAQTYHKFSVYLLEDVSKDKRCKLADIVRSNFPNYLSPTILSTCTKSLFKDLMVKQVSSPTASEDVHPIPVTTCDLFVQRDNHVYAVAATHAVKPDQVYVTDFDDHFIGFRPLPTATSSSKFGLRTSNLSLLEPINHKTAVKKMASTTINNHADVDSISPRLRNEDICPSDCYVLPPFEIECATSIFDQDYNFEMATNCVCFLVDNPERLIRGDCGRTLLVKDGSDKGQWRVLAIVNQMFDPPESVASQPKRFIAQLIAPFLDFVEAKIPSQSEFTLYRTSAPESSLSQRFNKTLSLGDLPSLTKQDLKQLLFSLDSSESTFFHLYVSHCSAAGMKILLDMLSPDSIKELIFMKDSSGANSLARVAETAKPECLMPALFEYLSQSDLKQLLPPDGSGSTFFRLCAHHCSAADMKMLLDILSPDSIKKLIFMEDSSGCNSLIRATENIKHEDLMPALLEHVRSSFNQFDIEQLLFHQDRDGQTFFHRAACINSVEHVRYITAALPRQPLLQLSQVRDRKERTARDIAKVSLVKDYIDQAGSYPVEFYHLETPPRVLIFYSTKNRQSPESDDGEQTDAETEKDCVEKYFTERGFRCKVNRDPTASEMFSSISAAQVEDGLSGLLVFVMTHGMRGVVTVEGEPGILRIHDIITHMCCGTESKPKMLVLQACQVRNSSMDYYRTVERSSSTAATTSRTDPAPAGSGLQQAMKEGISLKQPNFLVYMATVTGTALRHVMIPCLIESLSELGPSEDVLQACLLTNMKIQKQLKILDPRASLAQLPKIECTMMRKFCIGKFNPPSKTELNQCKVT